MAEEKKKGYPKIPRGNWFLLREKFKQRTPEKVSPSYIASALGMSESSASANIIPPLRTFGLIDDNGKPTDVAYDWRDDKKYSEVCRTIFESIYPQELRDLFHDNNANVRDIENWFARSTKVGQAAARAYTSTYMLLLEADLTKTKEQNGATPKVGPSEKTQKTPRKSVQPSAKPSKTASFTTHTPEPKPPSDEYIINEEPGGKSGFRPKLHVDIQIHISPDSSPEQIDKIFESMAKHLPFKG